MIGSADHRGVVRGADHGLALLVSGGGQQSGDGPGVVLVLPRGRLVDDQQPPRARERPGQRQALGFPGREPVDALAGAVGESSSGQRRGCALGGGVRVPAAYPQHEHGVLLGAQEPDRRGLLREISDPLPAQARELLTVAVTERVAVERDLARTWVVEPGHQLQQRRFPLRSADRGAASG